MKIEKKQISGCVKVITNVSELPPRATSVGGASYAVGSIIELDEVVEMKPLEGSSSTRNWFGVSALVNGAVAVVGFNTLLGTYFDIDRKRQTIKNGLESLSIAQMTGKTIKVASVEEYQTPAFLTAEEREAGKVAEILTKNMPIFVIVETAKVAKAPKAEKVEKAEK